MEYSLHLADYVVFIATIVVSLVIGLGISLKSKSSHTKEGYFVGNRKSKGLPMAISLLVTYESSIMMLGTPAEVYIYGPSILINGLACFVGDILAAYVTGPLFRPLKVTSCFEYLQLRFQCRAITLLSIGLYFVSYLFYMGIVLFGPAVALEAVTGLSRWALILSLATSSIIYTSLGGIVSVVWTDVFQAAVMLAGIFAIIIKGTIDVGGVGKVWEYARKGQRLEVFNFDPDPTVRHTVWTLFLPTLLRNFQVMFNQSTVQRVVATKSHKSAKRVLLGAAYMALLLFVLVVLEGIVLYAYFARRSIAEPLSCGLISNPNQIVPYGVMVLFHKFPGMPGLFLAALISASLSTLSSGLSSMSMVLIQDIVTPVWGELSEKTSMTVARISVVILGVIISLVTVLVSVMSGSLNQISTSLVFSTLGAFSGVFILACFFPSTISKGALLGAFFGSCAGCIFSLGQNFVPGVKKTPWLPFDNSGQCNTNSTGLPMESSASMISFNTTTSPNISESSGQAYTDGSFSIFNLSYALTGALGITVTVTIGILASYIIGRNRPGDVNSSHFLEISESLLIWLPAPLRNRLKALGPQFKSGWNKSVFQQADVSNSESLNAMDEREAETKQAFLWENQTNDWHTQVANGSNTTTQDVEPDTFL